LEIVFGIYAIYNVIYKCRGPKEKHVERGEQTEPASSTSRSKSAKQRYRIKVLFFLGLWSVNLAVLIGVMFAYCFAEFAQVGSPLLHSILSIPICIQFAMTVNFTKVISFIIEMRSCESETLSGMSTTAFKIDSFKDTESSVN
jgi:hypothetical protein